VSKCMILRPLTILLAGAALVACGDQARIHTSGSAIPAATPSGVGWEGVIEAPPLAEAVAVGVGWEGVIEAPPLAEPWTPAFC
jgi:hypothetical protein